MAMMSPWLTQYYLSQGLIATYNFDVYNYNDPFSFSGWAGSLTSTGSQRTGSVQSVYPDKSVTTGIDPGELANALYGRVIPISVLGDSDTGGGLERIGAAAGPIFGPYYNSGAASFAISFGFPANPSGTRKVYEIALDGKIVWELAAGSPAGAINPSGFVAEAFTCRFYSGTLTQTADSLEVEKFGSEAVAYRPQMMLWFENLNLFPFGGRVPFVSCKIGDTTGGAVAGDGVNLGTCLQAIAESPWIEYTSDTFSTSGVTDIVQGIILTEDQTFLNMLQNMARVYRSLDILQTDKLEIIDRGGNTAPDITLTRDTICGDSGVTYSRQSESATNRELELLTIDQDADYVFMPSKVSTPRDPVPVTTATGRESITLPIIMDAATRASLVHFAKYYDEAARKSVQFSAMVRGYEIEPGDLIALSNVADGFENEVFKVVGTSHDANYEVEIVAQTLLNCDIQFGILDDTGPTAAWSMNRPLLTDYVDALYDADGDFLLKMYDQTGNGNHMSQTGLSTLQPTVNTGAPSDVACALFLGNDFLVTTGIGLADLIDADEGYMIVSVIFDQLNGSSADVWKNDPALADNAGFVGLFGKDDGGDPLEGEMNAYNWDGDEDHATGSPVVIGEPYVLEWRHEGGLIYQRINGANETSTASGNTTGLAGNLQMGRGTGLGGAVHLVGRIFEGATWDTVPSQSTRDAIVANFMSRLGI